MKGSQWRFIIAIAAIAIGYYFFVYKGDIEKPVPTEDTRIWPNKIEALAQMKINLGTIVEAEINEKMLSDSYIECAPNPTEIPERRTNWDRSAAEGWEKLGVSMPRDIWFQYEVEVTGDNSFIVYARTYAEGPILEFTMDQDKNFAGR